MIRPKLVRQLAFSYDKIKEKNVFIERFYSMTDPRLKAELLSWFNQRMDLSSTQIDIVDGFVFMLKKVNAQTNLRTVGSKEFHPRFWRAHHRAFGYRIRTKRDVEAAKQMHEFYLRIAFYEEFLMHKQNQMILSQKGKMYLTLSKEEQLEQILTHIWS